MWRYAGDMMTDGVKACPHCRRKVRQFVAEKRDCRTKARQRQNSATVALLCDSLTFLKVVLSLINVLITVRVFMNHVDRRAIGANA